MNIPILIAVLTVYFAVMLAIGWVGSKRVGGDFDKINNVQMSNRDKKLLADLVINTDKPKNLLKLEVLAMLDGLEKEL